MNSKAQKASLKLIKKAFTKLKTYETSWLDYERMYKSQHTRAFLDLAKEQERNAIFIPLTYSTINIADSVFTSAFFSTGNPIEILKVGAADEDKRSELKRVVDYFYTLAKPYNELSKAFLSASIFGIGNVKINWDENKKLPDTTMLPPTEVAFDPDAISSKDSGFTGYQFSQTLSDINSKLESGFYKCEERFKEPLIRGLEDNPYKRKVVKEIYAVLPSGKWEVKTFISDTCVRETTFNRNHIKSGYMLHCLPAIDQSVRNDQIASIGDSLARVLKPLNEELNVKRNQRMDLIEKHINPDVYVPKSCGLDPEDENKNGGVKSVDKTAGIMFAPITGASEFTTDVAMLKGDAEDASSVNGIMKGQTSASDRRSGSALANVNANSSLRLESMVKLINETLFEPWAQDFVYLCYVNADDDLILKILEQETHSLGVKGTRANLDIDIKVNFGMSINKNAKIQDLVSIVTLLQEKEGADVNGLLRQIIKLTLGENADVEAIFGVLTEQGDGSVPANDGTRDGQAALATDGRGRTERDGENNLQDARDSRSKEINQITNNEI